MLETLKIKKLYEDVKTPCQADGGSVGFDLCVRLDEHYTLVPPNKLPPNKFKINPGGRVHVGTGLKVEIPEGYFMMIVPRSSMGIKKGLVLQNTLGVIDSSYRGEIKIFLQNISNNPIEIEQNERLVQAIILSYPKIIIEEVQELSETTRGSGGFGSTGSK